MSNPTSPTSETIARLRAEFAADLSQSSSDRDLQTVRDKYLARKGGVVAALMKAVAAAAADERPTLGRLANQLKSDIEARLAERKTALETSRPPAGALDVTLPGRAPRLGRRHPLTIIRDRLEEIFTRMGFAIVEGPEVEDEWHCFDALNMPAEHPARDMQDTLYLATSLPGLPGLPGDSPTERRT